MLRRLAAQVRTFTGIGSVTRMGRVSSIAGWRKLIFLPRKEIVMETTIDGGAARVPWNRVEL